MFQPSRHNAKADAPIFDRHHCSSEQHRNLFVRALPQQLVVFQSPRSALAVDNWNPQLDASDLHGNHGAPQSLGQLAVAHCSEQLVLGFQPCPVPGMEARNSQLPTAADDRDPRPSQLAVAVPVSQLSKQGIFLGCPRAFRPLRLGNSQIIAALLNGRRCAIEPAGKILVPQRSEPFVFFGRPTAQSGIELCDSELVPLLYHGHFRPSQLRGNFRVGCLAEQAAVCRGPPESSFGRIGRF